MTLGITEDQRALAASIADWAASQQLPDRVRAGEHDEEPLAPVWPALVDLGVAVIAVPEARGGAGGTVLDLACALEAAAAALVPGPLLPTALAATVLGRVPEPAPDALDLLAAVAAGRATVAVAPHAADLLVDADGALSGELPLVWGAGATSHLLAGGGGHWHLVAVADPGVELREASRVDLSRGAAAARLHGTRPAASIRVDDGEVVALAAALGSAEAAGVARWSLRTAVEHAKVREQFGRTIGSFQAVKHLCAEMLERAESATAVAWDAAAAQDDGPGQAAFAAAVSAAVAPDAAVRNAQDCIQVLGGIGFTWEHDAHLYLRRALATRLMLRGADRWRIEVAARALEGTRRATHVDLDGAGEELRAEIRADVAGIAALPPERRRAAMAQAGLVAPHYPPPYGRGAGAVEQVVIEEELAAAGLQVPELAIGAWALPTILEHGDERQRERFVVPTLRGEIAWCQLFSEPGAGSDLASLRTRAERVDGGWRLTGQKVWTSLAREADWAICLARTGTGPKPHHGITYFLVDMRSAGIDIRPLREMTGDAVFNEVFLDGVVVADDCVVGEVDGGWPLARTTLANERVAMGGHSLGASVERALAVARDRKELDDATRLRLGAAVAEATTVKVLGLRSTLRAVTGVGPGPESSVSKLVGVRQRQDSAELVLDLLGEAALLGSDEADRVWHEALLTRCLSIAGGTTQILRNVAAERILGLPRG